MILYQFLRDLWQHMAMTNDRYFRENCDFSGWMTQREAGFLEEEGNQYQPSSDRLVDILKQFPIEEKDAILDIGCGKGKAMYLMSRFPFHKIRGYDISEKLVQIANGNFRKTGLKQCKAINANALNYDSYDEFNYFFMFNSFPEDVFSIMMKHIMDSIDRRTRKCVFIYMNPVCHTYMIEHTPFRLVYKKRGLLRWYDYYCYEYEPDNNDKKKENPLRMVI